MPSITSWTRLEPRCRDADLQHSVRARLYDPLWLLARQWQMGEFEGEDAGSPVLARWQGQTAPLTRLQAGAVNPAKPRPQPYSVAALPLEAAVERQSVSSGPGFEGGGSLRRAVEGGLHFLRLLAAQATSVPYRDAFVQRFGLQPPTAAERATLDDETLDHWDLMAQRVPDARLLAAAWRGTATPVLPAELGIAAADQAEVREAVTRWLAQYAQMFAEPPAGQDAWQRERLEYAFSAGAGLGDRDITLTGSEYHGGHLDWHSVDVDPAVNLGALADRAWADVKQETLPAPVSFRGAPARRFWEFEDARVDFGLLPTGEGDLAHMLLANFATQFGNDWYVIPVELPVGSLTRTRSLVVVDSFGVQTLIRPHLDAGPSEFSMYSLSTLPRPGPSLASSAGAPPLPQPNLFYLPPSVPRTLDSSPREELNLLRDEMANMAWAVERVVQGPLEQRIDLAAQAAAAGGTGPAADSPGQQVPRYRLATEVPAHWVPLLPQRNGPGAPGLRLVRAQLLGLDGQPTPRPARSVLLGGAALALYDEEVPREGLRVLRGYQCARWLDGSTVLWLGHRKQVGRGEGASALRYDSLQQP